MEQTEAEELLKIGSNLAKDVHLVCGCRSYKASTRGELKDATILRGYFCADHLKQGCPVLLLESIYPAELSSNTH